MCIRDRLYAGGQYLSMGGSIPYIAKWDGVSWSSLGVGTNAPVIALAVYNGALYAGGTFSQAGGFSATNIAKWQSSTADIKESMIDNEFQIFPNPFTTQTTVDLNTDYKNATLKIIDVLGKELRSTNFSGKQVVLEREELKAGMYFIQIISENKLIATNKIIIN